MRGAAAVLFAMLGVACSGSGSRLLVELRTDYVPGTEFSEVVTQISGYGRTFRRAAEPDDAYRAGIRVAEARGVPVGMARVTVTLIAPDGAEVAHASTIVDVSGTTGVPESASFAAVRT